MIPTKVCRTERDDEAAQAPLQRLEPQLGATGQRDERDGERVDRLESLDRFVIDEVQDVRPRDDPANRYPLR